MTSIPAPDSEAPPRLTLAIETSCLPGSVALLDGDAVLGERELPAGARHGAALLPAIQSLLAACGATVRDCRLLAVSVGPGSFTGLRVGVTCAKTLAYATGCPIAAVETHRAVAENAPRDVRALTVVSDAQLGDVYLSRYVRDEQGVWSQSLALSFLPVALWLQQLSPDEVVSGPALEKLAPQVATSALALGRECWLPRAAMTGRLGIAAAREGRLADPWTLEPLYLRRSSAEERWDQRLAGGQRVARPDERQGVADVSGRA